MSEISRRELLRTAALAGGGLATASLAPGVAFGASGSRLTPFDLHFSTTHQYRPFDLIGRGFAQHTERSVSTSRLVRTRVGPVAPFATVILDVAEAPAGGRVAAGLVDDAGTGAVVTYDTATRRVAVEVLRKGASTVAAAVDSALTAPFRFAFVVNENYVVALADSGSGWQPLVRARITDLLDLRRPATLARLRYGYGTLGSGHSSFDRVQAGYYGEAGVRDPHVVTYADGKPFIRDGKVYLTLTQAGLGFFQAAHWGVWTLDLEDPRRLEQVANLFFRRNGVVLGRPRGAHRLRRQP